MKQNIVSPSLQRYISQLGHCSRRKAADLIVQGKVELDGKICTLPWQSVEQNQHVKVEGIGIDRTNKRLLYLALYKPPGYLSANSDPEENRPCAIDLIQPIYKERLFHVGRLDKNSSGLILFTNDGDLAQTVQHPSSMIEKEYEVKTRKSIPEFMLEHWQRGIHINGVRYKLCRYQMLGQRKVQLVLTEGLNREVRRVFEHFHIPLKRVHRLRVDMVRLYGLAPGEFRKLKPFEIRALQTGKKVETPKKTNQGKNKNYNRDRYTKATTRQKQRGLYNTPSNPYPREKSATGQRHNNFGIAKTKKNQTKMKRRKSYSQ